MTEQRRLEVFQDLSLRGPSESRPQAVYAAKRQGRNKVVVDAAGRQAQVASGLRHWREGRDAAPVTINECGGRTARCATSAPSLRAPSSESGVIPIAVTTMTQAHSILARGHKDSEMKSC